MAVQARLPSDHRQIEGVARRAAAAFGAPEGAGIEFIKQRENAVFRVRAAGLDRSLRLHRVGHRTVQQLEAEAVALIAYRAAGIPVFSPVSASAGGMVVMVDDRQTTMQEWIPDGTVLGVSSDLFVDGGRPDDDEFRELGAVMARMHLIAESGSVSAGVRPAWDAEGLVGPDSLWGDPGNLRSVNSSDRFLLRRARRRIAESLQHAPSDARHYGLIHADLTFENVLITPKGIAVLDFDDSGDGWYLFDLATPFFWCARRPDAAGILDLMVEGYRTVRDLEFSESLWQALLLARGLSYLGWAAERAADPAAEFIERCVAPVVIAATRRYVDTGDTGWTALARQGTEQ